MSDINKRDEIKPMYTNKRNNNIEKNENDVNNKKYQDLDFDNFDEVLCKYYDGDLLAGIYGHGFERPSPIQAKAILPICDGRDIIAQAQAGSGKTGAFGISSLARVDTKKKYPQIIILGNTRRLADQNYAVLKSLGEKLISNHGLKIGLCIGGGGDGRDINSSLRDAMTCQILVGTPGKFVALIENDKKNKIKFLDRVTMFVLDEADALLKEEFAPQIQKIMKQIPKDAQICLFSATYPESVIKLTQQFLNNPLKILVEREEITVASIKNYWVNVEKEEYKFDNLVDLYQKINICQAVIFVNSVKKAMDLAKSLEETGQSVGVIHAKLEESEQTEILKHFRLTQTRVLIATDLISRGIDVQSVGLVINYDVPFSPDSYVHRAGRSGRFGKLGVAITFVNNYSQDWERMENIENQYGISFNEMKSSNDVTTVNNYLTGSK